jgi:hypothetical protein
VRLCSVEETSHVLGSPDELRGTEEEVASIFLAAFESMSVPNIPVAHLSPLSVVVLTQTDQHGHIPFNQVTRSIIRVL